MKIFKTANYKKIAQVKGYIRVSPSDIGEGYKVSISVHREPGRGDQVLKENVSLEEAGGLANRWKKEWGYEIINESKSTNNRYDQFVKKNTDQKMASQNSFQQDKKQLALKLLDWHGGQSSYLYSVGSSWYAGNEVPRENIEGAILELKDIANKKVNYPETVTPQDIQEVNELQNLLKIELRN